MSNTNCSVNPEEYVTVKAIDILRVVLSAKWCTEPYKEYEGGIPDDHPHIVQLDDSVNKLLDKLGWELTE